MVLYCCAYGCKQSFVKGGGVTFHSFPKDEVRRKLWVAQLKRKDFKVTNFTKICSKHFKEDCFDRGRFGGTWLKQDATPTVFNFPDHLRNKKTERKPPKDRTCGVEGSVSQNQGRLKLQNGTTQSCAAYGCKSTFEEKIPGITFHGFSKDESLKLEWVKAVGREDWVPKPMACLCSKHFQEKDFERVTPLYLKSGTVPSVFREHPSYLQKIVNIPVSEPTFQESKRSTSQYLIDQQESSNQALYTKLLKKDDLPVYPVSISKASDVSSYNLVNVLKLEIECLRREKESSNSEMENFKQKIEHLQQENKSVSIDNKMLRNKIEQLEHSNKLKRKQLKVLQQYKRRIKQRVKTVKGINTSLKENEGRDDYPQKGTFEFGDGKNLPKNKSDTKIENMDLCHPEELIVVGHVVSPEAEP